MIFFIIIFSFIFINSIKCFETNLKLKCCMPKKDSKYIYEYHYIASVNNNYLSDYKYSNLNYCEKYLNCCTPDDIFCWNTVFNDEGKLLDCSLQYANKNISCINDFINSSSSGICYILNKNYTY